MLEEGGARAERGGWRGTLQIVVIVVGVLVAIWFARAPQGQAHTDDLRLAEPGVPTVTVIRPAPGEAAQNVRTTGAVTILDGVRLFSHNRGEVVFVAPALRNGGSFSAGETLVRIDQRDATNRLEAAQARVRYAEARLLRQEHKAEAAVREFHRDHPGEEPPPLVARTARIAEKAADLDRALKGVEQAEIVLSRTEISVPFDGQVAGARATVGQVVGRDTPLGLVYRNGALQVEAQISQEELASLEPIVGRRATVRAGGREFAASVDRVAAVVDRESRLVTLFLAFRGNARNLPRPGTFAIVGLGGPVLSDVFALPEAAEQPGGNVWVVDGGALRSVTPTTLGRTEAGWLVEAFDPRQGVVVGRVVGARPGLAVRVAE